VTELDQIAVEMEDEAARRRLAEELLRLRRLANGCRRFKRRLPGPLQSLVDAPARIAEEPPPLGDPRLI
jgi:hypothetical protein